MIKLKLEREKLGPQCRILRQLISKIGGELNPSSEKGDLKSGSETSSASSKAELTKECRSKLEPKYGCFNRPDSLNAPVGGYIYCNVQCALCNVQPF